jgi:hypothetical protein
MNLDIAKQQFSKFLTQADDSVSVSQLHTFFVIEKMRLDKYFSEFLDENETEMNQSENFDSPSWETYRKKMKEYDDIERLVTHSKYYAAKHV